MTARGTTETRPGEPGASGRDTSITKKIQDAMGSGLGAPQVVSAQLIGTDVNGRRVYKIAVRTRGAGVNYITRALDGSNLKRPSKLRGTPSRPGEGATSGGVGDPALDQVRERWHQTVTNMTLSPLDKQNLNRFIDRWNGDAKSLDQIMQRKVEEAGLRSVQAEVGAADSGTEDPFDPFAGIDFGGGVGGGGFSGPTYTAPDRRVVEDFVTGALVSLIGTVPSDDMVNQFADVYMADHRRNFDNPGQEIDPSQSVKEAIRSTEQYQSIHALRPESEDERAWIAQRKQAAARGGLNVEDQEQFAIDQATVGGDEADVQRAASVEQFSQSGSARGTLLEDRIRQSVAGVFSEVVR